MGNCMETCMNRQAEIDIEHEHHQHDQCLEEENEKEGGFDEKRKVRIKVVLTKDELEWLVFQLEDKNGRSIEDVLAEIERCRGKLEESSDSFRGKVVSWKPVLESIIESPEF